MNEQINLENTEHLLNFAHAKNGEVYIYNEDGNEDRLASYVAALCTSKLSADDILNGDCFECDFACAAGVLKLRHPSGRTAGKAHQAREGTPRRAGSLREARCS